MNLGAGEMGFIFYGIFSPCDKDSSERSRAQWPSCISERTGSKWKKNSCKYGNKLKHICSCVHHGSICDFL